MMFQVVFVLCHFISIFVIAAASRHLSSASVVELESSPHFDKSSTHKQVQEKRRAKGRSVVRELKKRKKKEKKSSWIPPLCGDCWCVPSIGSECPDTPKYKFSSKKIAFFQGLELTSGDLTCSPKKPAAWIPENFWPSIGNSCYVADFTGGNDAVCAFLYDTPESKKSCPTSYSLKTYDTKELARSSGAFVTHNGPCGMCSNAKDLAVYMTKPDLTTEVTDCIKLGIIPVVIQCLTTAVGFTPGCALVYLEDYIITNFFPNPQNPKCPALCQDPASPNGPPPDCVINPCLACNEEASKAAGVADSLPMDFFTTYAGRTRRNSGLLSNIIRQCDSFAADITQKDCPKFETLN